MFRSLALNRVLWAATGLLLVFVAMHTLVEPNMLMGVLNGLFAGMIVGIVAAYFRLIFEAIRRGGEYDRIRGYSLGVFLPWVALFILIGVSIYTRSTELYTGSNYMAGALGRYIAIIAAVMQVNALDFSYALMHGRDKMIVRASIVLGIVVALATIAVQQW